MVTSPDKPARRYDIDALRVLAVLRRHQTVIVVLAYYVVRWQSTVAVKFLALSTASLAATIVLCELLRQSNVTRFLFGMPAKRRPARANGP